MYIYIKLKILPHQLSAGKLTEPSMAISGRLCNPLYTQSSRCLNASTTSTAYIT